MRDATGMAWNFVAMADASFWSPHFQGVNFARIPEADFEIEGRAYGVFAHDWRVEPPADWMMGVRTPMPFVAADGDRAAQPPTLSETDFRRAVRESLHHYTRQYRLIDTPLRFTRLLHGTPPGPSVASAVQRLLREAVATLDTSPRDRKLHRAVWHTYFEPLDNQERVAVSGAPAVQHLPAPSRRWIERIADWLWHRERASVSGP